MTDQNIIIKPVDPSIWSDFEALFQSRATPRYCWCMVWRANQDERKNTDPASRKGYMKQRIFDKVPVGLLAYIASEPIAWCSVAPRETYYRLGGDDTLTHVWSLVCFFIRKEHRRQGMVEMLINSAKVYARRNGAKYLEAYPVDPDSPSYRFMGYISSFEKAGFTFIKKAGLRRNVMICDLKGTGRRPIKE
jgi:GNAT superfamily N-acetyltransferase